MKKDRDFDRYIDRRGTGSFKWDSGGRYGLEEDKIIPMWVADMDFPCAPPIIEAVTARAAHGIYGYPVRDADHVACIRNWQTHRFGATPEEAWMCFAPPGVIYAIYIMMGILTEKGDQVICLMPNYDPLFEGVWNSGRTLVESPLMLDKEGMARIDYDDLEEKMAGGAKMLILSSPHNPTGRVWSRKELERLADLAVKHDVFVISDEIHADFICRSRGHVPYYSLGEEIARRSMSCYSANKGFNLGGFQTATLIIADPEKKALFEREMNAAQTRLDNIFGAVATKAAYSDPACESWLDDAIAYVEENKQYLYDYVGEHLPSLRVIPSEGTYLVWVDCSGLGCSDGRELERFFLEEARVEPCMGYEFGDAGEQFVRLNLACPRDVLKKALARICAAAERREEGDA